jgi:hypothetical protein
LSPSSSWQVRVCLTKCLTKLTCVDCCYNRMYMKLQWSVVFWGGALCTGKSVCMYACVHPGGICSAAQRHRVHCLPGRCVFMFDHMFDQMFGQKIHQVLSVDCCYNRMYMNLVVCCV